MISASHCPPSSKGLGATPAAGSKASHADVRRVAVIGAGIAGLSCAEGLRGQGHAVWVFDKSRGPSGRASTRRGEGWACDHGAQYFTAEDPAFIDQVRRWCEAGVAAPWSPRLHVVGQAPAGLRRRAEHAAPIHRYVGVPAMTSPAQALAARLRLSTQHTIDALQRSESGWRVRSAEHGWLEPGFDSVVLALPAPQALALLRGVHDGLAALAARAPMQPCWTVTAVFDHDPLPQFDAAFVNLPVLSWVCANHRKPHRAGQACWVLQAQPAWSRAWLEAQPDAVLRPMLEAFAALGARDAPRLALAHRWRYARGALEGGVPDAYGVGSGDQEPRAAWDSASRLGLCGDWLCGGRVEGAWLSGRALSEALDADVRGARRG